MDIPSHDELCHLLKELVPICNLQDVSVIANQSRIYMAEKGDTIFLQGKKDNNTYYLLDGKIELASTENNNFKVSSQSEDARYPLAQFQPRQYSATCLCESLILVVDRNVLDTLLMDNGNNPNAGHGLEVSEIDQEAANDWMTRVLQSPLFTTLSADNIQQVFSKMQMIEVKKEECIIRQGHKGDYYYIIQQGKCMVSRRPTTSSQDIKLAELSEGDTFGEESLVGNIDRNASVKMITDGVLIRLKKQDFIRYIRDPILQSVNHNTALQLISNGAMWLDVRPPNEYQINKQQNSINIPLNLLRLQISKLDREAHYVVCCDTGERSAIAAFILTQEGFQASHLENGLQYSSENIRTPDLHSSKTSSSNVLPFRMNEQIEQVENNNWESRGLKIEIKRLKDELQGIRDKFQELLDIKNDTDTVNASLQEATEQKLKVQRERIDLQAKNANKLIKQAQQMKKELECEKQAIRSEVERYRVDQEKAVAYIREEISRRLKEEEQKMDEFYAWKQREIEHIIAMKNQAERLLENTKRQNKLRKQTSIHAATEESGSGHSGQCSNTQQNKIIPEQLLELQRKLLEQKERALKINEKDLLEEINDDLNAWLNEQKTNNNSPTVSEIEKRKQMLIENARKRAESARMISKAHDQLLLSEISTILNN